MTYTNITKRPRKPRYPVMRVSTLKAKLNELDKGVLYRGSHDIHDHEFCALEFKFAADTPNFLKDRELLDHFEKCKDPFCTRCEDNRWTIGNTPSTYLSDEPRDAEMPDIRSLNDAKWLSNEQRTHYLLPILAKLWYWEKWTSKKKALFYRIAVELLRNLVGDTSESCYDPDDEFVDLLDNTFCFNKPVDVSKLIIKAIKQTEKEIRF